MAEAKHIQEEGQKLKAKNFESDQDIRWCPGCGDYSILKQVQGIMPELGIPKENSRAIGFADMRPKIEPRDSTGKLVPGAREVNRRVEIIIHY